MKVLKLFCISFPNVRYVCGFNQVLQFSHKTYKYIICHFEKPGLGNNTKSLEIYFCGS